MVTTPAACPRCAAVEIHFRRTRGDWVCDVCEHAWKPETTVAPAAPTGPRLFLSYGRRDAAELADRLRRDLQARGFQVWQDTRQIRSGKAWEQEIVDGLRHADAVVAVLSPHAVRTAADAANADADDSVCLDEISYARFARPPKPIVPVMAVPCEPPFCIFRLDYVNLVQWRDEAQYQAGLQRLADALAAAVRGEVRYRSWEDRLRPWDFSAFLEEKRRHFCGREWLFAEVEAWRRERPDPALLITGDPGTGKSAVVAELVRRNPGGQVLAYHCCIADTRETLQPGRFVRSVAAMIASQLPDYAARLRTPAVEEALGESSCARDPASAFELGVLAPLAALPPPPGGPRYLLIDALDEALLFDEGSGRATIVDVLATRLQRLPAWLRVVATSRKERGVLDRLRGLSARELDAHDPRNVQDLERYISTRLQEPALAERLTASGQPAAAVTRALLDRADGNILYVVQALEGVERDRYRFADLGTLPPGLFGLYHGFFQRLFPTAAAYQPVRALLEVVVAAREPLPADTLGRAAGVADADALARVLRGLAAYLPDRDGRLTVYHKSFTDWLTDPAGRGGPFHVDARRGHQRLANLFTREYNQAGRGLTAYGLAHLPRHLAEAGRTDDLARLLTSLPFLEAKAEAGRVFDLVADFLDALERLPVDQPRRPLLRLMEEALLTDIHFLARHPGALFQCLWNRGWWYDCPDAARHYDAPDSGWPPQGPPWQQPGPKLAALLEAWRADRERDRPGSPWIQALRPPAHHLGTAQRAVFRGHEGPVAVVAFTPDGRRLVTGGKDGTVRFWDAARGAELACLRGHVDTVLSIDVSPDGRRLASGGMDRTVRVWDCASGTELRNLRGHVKWLHAVRFLPDGRHLLSASEDWTIRLWDLATGAEVACLRGHTAGVTSLALAPDGKRLLSGSSDGTVRIWDLELRHQLAVLSTQEVGIGGVAWSPDGRRLLATTADGGVLLYDAATHALARDLRGHDRRVYGAAFSPDGRRIVSGSADGTVRLWDADTGTEVGRLTGHEARVFDVAFSPDGRRVASASWDGTVRVWDSGGGVPRARLRDHDGKIRALVWTADGTGLLSAGDDGTVRRWDPADGTACVVLRAAGVVFRSVAVAGDGRRGAAAAENGVIHVWDAAGGDARVLAGHTGAVLALAFAPSGRLLASGSWDETVRLWDLATGAEVACLRGHRDRVWRAAFTADGGRLVTASADGTECVWSVPDGAVLATQPESRPGESRVSPPAGRARVDAQETVFDAGPAWFPAAPSLLQPQPGGRIWAGAVGNHLLLLRSEGAAADPYPPESRSA